MFDLLTRYIVECKRIALPQIGVFELVSMQADPDLSNNTIIPPKWLVSFAEDRQSADSSNNEKVSVWLSAHKHISKEEAHDEFFAFTKEIIKKLSDGIVVNWDNVGTLKQIGDNIVFDASTDSLSPFTTVTAKKIQRGISSHATLVGDRETTMEQMQQELSYTEDKPKGNTVLWVLLAVAVVVIGWYFSQNGCNLKSIGNSNKVETAKPEDTYKIQ